MVENGFKQKRCLREYCFKHEYKLKSKNPEKVLNNKIITVCEEETRWSFEKTLSLQKKIIILTYQQWAETQ